MPQLLVRILGLVPDERISVDSAVLLIQRCSTLSRSESQVILLDYMGVNRDEICAHMGVSSESVRTYWKRIYRKIGCHTRTAARTWVEALLNRELGKTA
ncbi:MAG: hypothetical protein HC828_03520 [Blastochloris sp.]|nr:hypothetical protein [Blastochloris sp.]